MSTLSTHVLDTSLGKPAAGMSLKLEQKSSNGNWVALGEYSTNADGRVPELNGKEKNIETGVYRFVFDTKAYLLSQNKKGFYPYAEIVFEIEASDEHYHVPLLVSGWGYSTYRGS